MSMVIGRVTWARNLKCTWILNWFMFSTNCVTRLTVFSFEIVPVWKSSFTKVTLADRLRGLLRLISLNCPLGHQTSIFTCPRSKFSCPGNCTWVFSCFALNAKGHTLCAYPFSVMPQLVLLLGLLRHSCRDPPMWQGGNLAYRIAKDVTNLLLIPH